MLIMYRVRGVFYGFRMSGKKLRLSSWMNRKKIIWCPMMDDMPSVDDI